VDCIEAIMGRRSIRQYAPDPVTDDELGLLLRAAMAAPSAGNQQPWHFVTVRERALLDELSTATQYAAPLARAPLGLVVCAETRDLKHPGYWVIDCSAAIENLLVAAHAAGLGAVWIGVYPVQERVDNVARIIGTPEGIVPMSMVGVGHPAEGKPPAERFRPELVHAERW
jgi:nitroreductase